MPTRSTTGLAKPAARKPAAKAPAQKPAGARPASARTRSGKAGSGASGDRQRFIAEAAYFKAERRGFAEGGELGDWIEAEAEIDALLNAPGTS